MDKCTCNHCHKEYYNTPDNYSYYFCPDCLDKWWYNGCQIQETP
jgi:uncharacterized Zn ribbon protein